MDEDESTSLLEQIQNGDISVYDIVEAAHENDVDLDWQRQYDDWWTVSEGGFDVTCELGDETSWHSMPDPIEPTLPRIPVQAMLNGRN